MSEKGIDLRNNKGGGASSEEIKAIKVTLYGGELPAKTLEIQVSPATGVQGGYPPRYIGDIETQSGYMRRYVVDLQGAYNLGYRQVKFYAYKYQASSNLVAGEVITGFSTEQHPNGDYFIEESAIESYIETKSASEAYTAGEFTLPITPNSKYLVCALPTPDSIDNIGQYYVEKGYDPTYVPSTVTLMGGSVEGLTGQVSDLEDRVDALEDGGVSSFPSTYLPRKIYGVVGKKMQEFVRGIVGAIDPYRYYSHFVCGQGKVYRRYLEVTPELVSGALPTLTMKHQLIDDNYNKTTEKQSDIVVCARPSVSPASNLNVLCVGASTTASGQWPSELKRMLTGTLGSGSPEADGLTNITFVGRKPLAQYGDTRPVAINVEATGGWAWSTFINPTTPAIRFAVTGVSAVNIGTKYTFTDTDSNTVTVAVQ